MLYFPCFLPEVIVPSSYDGGFIISRRGDFVPLSLSSLMMCANNRLHYIATVVFVCSHIKLFHYLHYTAVSENIEFQKAHYVGCVCVSMIKPVLSIIFIEYMGLCVFSLPIPLVMIMTLRVRYPIIIIKSEIWIVCYWLEWSHETVVCAVYLSMLYRNVRMDQFDLRAIKYPFMWLAAEN